MHLLFMSGSGELGGAERSLLDMLASVRLAQPSWPLSLLAPADGPLLTAAAASGAHVGVLAFGPDLSRIGEPGGEGAGGWLDLMGRLTRVLAPAADYGRHLRAYLKTAAPDVIHTHGIKPHVLAAWSNPGSAAVVWHLHDYIGRRRASASMLRRSLGRCAAVVANSMSVADDARRVLGSRLPIRAVLNAVDLDRFVPDGARADLDAGGAAPVPGAVRVGLVATFGHWKGHTTFIDACARLPRDLSIRAYVIGGPIYRTDGSQHTLAELRAYAAQAGIADRITFTGFMPAADAALRALDIVVHASTEPEPFGLVIAEAMACGRAVIVADAGGAREIVTPDVDAVIHTPGDSASLAARIVDLVSDRERRVALGHAARRTAERRFDHRRLAAELLPIYAEAVKEARS